MKLTRIEIYGFKSFPERTDIRFDEGITGIVGPNGAGKSNIADAVRWVLGEQSAKALRGARMEDVIFSGTQKRKAMPYCEVSLYFDNQDGKLKNPHSEIMVTRRAYRTGEGEYFLNQKSCRLKDLVALFHDTGVGREGYSIIGQGHIDVILSGRGEERRAAFEEAAGIMAYRARKEEAEKKLTRTQEHLLRVNDLLDELGSRLEPLKAQSETARSYLALSARLKSLDANIFLTRHDRLSKRISTLKDNLQALAGQIAGYERALEENTENRRQVEASLDSFDRQMDEFGLRLRDQERLIKDQAVLRERSAQALEFAKNEKQNSLETAAGLEHDVQEIKAMLRETQSSSSLDSSRLSEVDAELNLLEAGLENANQELLHCEEALETHRSRMLETANTRANAMEQRARQEAMLSQAQERLREVRAGSAQADRESREAQESLELAVSRHDETIQDVENLKTLLDSKAVLDRQQTETLNLLNAELAARLKTGQSDQARLSALEDLAGAHEGFFQPVRQALLRAQGNQRVFGAVAQLLSVPAELETAVEMVLGSALQHIVTQDEEAAQELIDYLRDKRLGRATFLPLSAVKGRVLDRQERLVLGMPGCLGVASELVQFQESYAPAMESLLGRVVIARDLDAAIAISRAGRQTFHVVTLLGDVMRAGGAMTGGSVQNKTVSLLGREREIKELAASLKRQADEIEALQAEISSRQAMAEPLRDEINKMRLLLQDEEIGIAREEEKVRQAKERVQAAGDRAAQAQAALLQLDEMIADLTEDLARKDAASSRIDSDREAMEAEEARLKAAFIEARQAVDQARGAVETLRESRSQAAHKLEIMLRDKGRFEKEAAQTEAKIDKLHKAQAVLDKQMMEEAARHEQSVIKLASLNEGLEALQGESRAMEATRRELTLRQRQLTEESEQTHRRHTEVSQQLHKGEISLTRHEEELSNIAALLWNTHELTYALAQAYQGEERFDLPAAEREAQEVRGQIRDLGSVNIHAMDEYAATKARFDSLALQRDDAQQAREDLLNLIKRLQGQMEKQFVREFALLNEYFSETFKRLFSGGQASLSLAEPDRPLDCEILIKAQPPGKKLQLLSLLSGGERTLTAIAILFAMLKLKPTPFCVLDEIEAALDDANIYSFAQYLEEYKSDTQFIVITHRKGTMESCDTLYGVTMREKGVSDMISVNLQEYTA